MLTIQQKAQSVLWYKTLITLTALRDGLKILWKPAAFWIAKDRVGQALLKRLLMLCV